jgi:glycosyltransferase involved in cell wall biosynthesis
MACPRSPRLSRVRPIHVSLPWADIISPPPPHNQLTWSRRPVDWGLPWWRSKLLHVFGGLRIVLTAPRDGTVFICHTGMDIVVAGLARTLARRPAKVVAVDFLLPPRTPRRVVRFALRRIDEFIVIRSGDITTLASLGVQSGRCRFVPFAAPPLRPSQVGNFVYSGGFAQRDWGTLSRALESAGVDAIVACPTSCPFGRNVRAVGMVSPEEGQRWLSTSRFLIQAVLDTDLPSGPLLILDAFRYGKPVVATDVKGTRDYIKDGVNGLLVPPGDHVALAAATASLFNDQALLKQLSEGARRSAEGLTAELFWARVLDAEAGAPLT